MKEETLVKIFIACLIISISCNIVFGFIVIERYQIMKESKDIEEQMKEYYYDEWAKQQSYDMALSQWDEFECTFDNENLTLETECGGEGTTTITIFSNPRTNISIKYWDKYKSSEIWEEKNVDEIWVNRTGGILILPKKRIHSENYQTNISTHSWTFFTPANTWSCHHIEIPENITTNLTIFVIRETVPFNYPDGETYHFEPIVNVFEVFYDIKN